jgi:hypothetical protein
MDENNPLAAAPADVFGQKGINPEQLPNTDQQPNEWEDVLKLCVFHARELYNYYPDLALSTILGFKHEMDNILKAIQPTTPMNWTIAFNAVSENLWETALESIQERGLNLKELNSSMATKILSSMTKKLMLLLTAKAHDWDLHRLYEALNLV